MMCRSFALILFVLIGIGAGYAQAPETKSEKALQGQAFSWTFDSEGGYLGINTEEVTRENYAKFGLREVRGVGVENVLDGSPAQAAGLQKGDVIIRVNGDEITGTRKLSRLVSEIAPDHQARITVVRNGSEREITVTIGKRPALRFAQAPFELFGQTAPPGALSLPDLPAVERLPRIDAPPMSGMPGEPLIRMFGSRRQIGVSLTPLTKQLADHFGVESGALVNNVRENSAAAKAGIKAGDVITEVDGRPVKGELDLVRSINEKRDGSLNITIVRDRNRQTVSVTPEEVKGVMDSNFEFSFPEVPSAPGILRQTRPGAPAVPPVPAPMDQLLFQRRVI